MLLLVAAVAVGALLATPWLVERSLESYAAGAPNRVASTAAIRFDPRSLTLEIEGLELRDAAAGVAVVAPFASLDFDWRGFIGLGPRSFERIAIERPRLEGRSLPQLLELGAELARGPLAGLRIRLLEVDAAEVALAAADSDDGEPYGLVGVELELTDFDAAAAAADGVAPGHLELRAATADGAAIEVAGSVLGLERSAGQLEIRGHALTALPAWLGSVPLAEFHATLALDAEYVLTEPLRAARLEIADARIELANVTAVTPAGFAAHAEQVTGGGSLVIATAADGSGTGSVRVDLADARVDLTDGGAAPPQTFTLTNSTVSAAVAAADDDLSLALAGRLATGGQASLTVTYTGASDSSIMLAASALPAAVMAPYAEAAIGQGLAAGDYAVVLDYRQSAGRVAGEVRVAATNPALTAGALPPGPGAYAVELAVALLENPSGVAEVAASFTGDAADIRAAVGTALETRIESLAAAPFAVLAPLTASSAEMLRSVSFVPGETELGEPALTTVDSLATALVERPRLGVRVHGAVDPAADRLALARRQIELHVTLATAGAAFQARPEPVDFMSPRAQDILDEFAGERLPAERVTAIARAYNCGENPPPACRAAYYSAIFDALADNEPIPASTVTRLGRFRAQAVAEAFEARGIAAERIAVVAGAMETSADALGVRLPLELFPRSQR